MIQTLEPVPSRFKDLHLLEVHQPVDDSLSMADLALAAQQPIERTLIQESDLAIQRALLDSTHATAGDLAVLTELSLGGIPEKFQPLLSKHFQNALQTGEITQAPLVLPWMRKTAAAHLKRLLPNLPGLKLDINQSKEEPKIESPPQRAIGRASVPQFSSRPAGRTDSTSPGNRISVTRHRRPSLLGTILPTRGRRGRHAA